MSDAREAVHEAMRQQRLLWAKLDVREQALVEELTALAAEQKSLGDGGAELRAALGEKMALLEAERRELRGQRDAARGELAELDKIIGRLPAMEAEALRREALAFTGDPDRAPPPVTRMSEDEARAQLAALRAARAVGKGTDAASGDKADSADPAPAPDERTPPKRTL